MIRQIQREDAEANRVAEAVVRTWVEVAVRLAPIVGEQGFRVLYKRSLHVTASTFPWLAPAQTPPADSSFADLRLRLERETPAHAEEASRALFATFTRLLNALIGEALTTRLLASVPRHGGPDEPPHEVPQ